MPQHTEDIIDGRKMGYYKRELWYSKDELDIMCDTCICWRKRGLIANIIRKFFIKVR
jgi:hypothetical protein